ncbi:MAG: 1-acyl-sn-glycerol-3-phosphate acyltransferase [Firmicutes bacterium]|nr:1-acyl-sn-glycerol-3-phosphate acyltransferase [Bacillota bacterium]
MGPAIVVSNHVSYLDPILIGAALPRPVHFMAKEELFRYPVLRWLLPKVHAFPVRRGRPDRQAIRRALDILESGQVVGIFPEGTRSASGELQDVHGGAAMLALKSGASVVPMVLVGVESALAGGRKIPRRAPIVVRIGPPFKLLPSGQWDREELSRASQAIRTALKNLLPTSRAGKETNKGFWGRKTYSSEGKKA